MVFKYNRHFFSLSVGDPLYMYFPPLSNLATKGC